MTALFEAPLRATQRQTIEIRMLGPLQVHRRDGSSVDTREWRTGKTADLVRLLALRPGQPVPAETLLTVLWPDSDQRRGQASLRTGVSQIRQVLGHECIERSLAGLVLRDAWVDVGAFRALAADVRRLMKTGDLARVEAVAREADALYRGDLRAHDDSADWAVNERRSLAAEYQVLLCSAADATIGRGATRDAVDFASRALELDPFCERACRLVMRGYAEMGETSQALRVYERCRVLLAEELGVDPSPQTRAVHLELLRTDPGLTTEQSNEQPYRHPEQVVRTEGDTVVRVSAPAVQAEARLQLAVTVCIPQRQFVRARRCAEEAANLVDLPAIQVRAVVASHLPDVLLGRPRAAQAQLEKAARLAVESGDPLVRRRLDVLRCLVAHDLASPSFEAQWSHAAASCELETDVNWAWVMIRIATERGDLTTAQVASQVPVAAEAGPLARKLHALASATLMAELGQVEQAIACLQGVIDAEDRVHSRLLLPEALARLVMLQAPGDLPLAEETLARLDAVLGGEPGLPRESFLRLMASATVHSARGRAAAAAAAAASAAAIAEANGLRVLAATAHESCARYTARARALAAGGARRGLPKLALTLSALGS